MKKHKKLKITLLMIFALLIVFLVGKKLTKKGGETNNVAIDYGDDNGNTTSNYYPGIIEPEQKYNINLDSERTVESIEVKVGDTVTTGQTLFTYQSKDYSLQIQQGKLEIEGLNSTISNTNDQINELTKERDSASNEVRLQYESQIQDLNSQLKQAELDKQTKQAEIDSLTKKVSASKVVSPIDGTVSSINANSDSGSPFITLLSSGSFRIKAEVDELNLSSLKEGMNVTIKTRVNDKKYTGKITKIDTKSTSSDSKKNQSSDSEESDSSNQASKFYFYVSIDNPDGLIVGQHIYVEPDTKSSEAK